MAALNIKNLTAKQLDTKIDEYTKAAGIVQAETSNPCNAIRTKQEAQQVFEIILADLDAMLKERWLRSKGLAFGPKLVPAP